MKTQALLISLALAATTLTSCLISVDSHTQHTGRRISEQTLSQIEPGRKDEPGTKDEPGSKRGRG